MSALFERQFGISTRQNVFMNTLGIRQNPVITQINAVTNRVTLDQDSRQYPFYVLENLLADARQNWMTSAAIQVSLNGTVLPWTHGGWSFIPVDLTAVTKPGAQGVKSASTNINITLQTAALRARLQCNAVPEVANLSSWLSRATPNATWRSTMDFNSTKDWYTLDDTIFEGSSSNTTTFVNENSIACCGNGTRDEPQPAAIGFWSPVDQDNFPFNDTQWPVPFVTKWIVGRALNLTVLKPWNTARKSQKLIVFEELPSLQAARCVPLIETANMTIIVDAESGFVYSHQMVGSVLPMESAWSDAFIRHQLTNSSQYFNGSYMGALNMTTR